jgi:predicted O-methyltransferase YrrM
MIGQAVSKFANEVRSPSDGVMFLSRLVVPIDPRARQLHSWLWGRLPRVALDTVIPETRDVDLTVLKAHNRPAGMSVTFEELATLLAISSATRARRILEVGTYNGNTALNLAANAPDDAVVITLDLPPADADRGALAVPDRFNNTQAHWAVGSHYRGTEHEHKIKQIYGDSTVVDWSTFVSEPLDLVFVDGCHYRPFVESDTNNALRHLRPGGIVVWHDYGYFKDVSDYVDEVAERMNVYAIGGTRLAIGLVDGGPR